MNIVCEKCATVYRIDASRIPAEGKKVKCSKCGHIFVARAGLEQDDVPTAEQGQDLAAELSEDVDDLESVQTDPGTERTAERKRLLLRQDGTRYAVSDLATLQRWIVERRVSRNAELSEDGEVWERVGERMDLLPFFGIVERTRKNRAARRRRMAGRHEEAEDAARLEASPSAGDLSDAPTVVQRRGGSGESITGEQEAPETVAGGGGARDGTPTRHREAESPPSAAKPETEASASSPRPGGAAAGAAPGSPLKALAAIVFIVVLVVGAFVVKVRYIDTTRSARPVVSLPRGTAPPPAVTRPPGHEGAGESSGHLAPAETTPALPAAPRSTPAPGEASLPAATAPSTGVQGKTGRETGAARPPVVSRAGQSQGTPTTAGGSTPPPVGAAGAATTTAKAATPRPQPRKPRPAPPSSPSGTSSSRLIAIGQAHLRNHRFDQAVEAFREAVRKSPNSPRTHKELGLGLLNLADVRYGKRTAYLEEAAGEFSQTIRLDSGYAEGYHLLGVTYMQLGRKAEAAENFRLALAHGLSGDDATEARVFLQNLVDELASEAEGP